CICPLGRITGAETNDEIARLRNAPDRGREKAWIVDGFGRTIANGADAFGKRATVDPGNRTFARRVKRRHEDAVGIIEAACEFVHEIPHASVTMWFDDGDHTAFGAAASRRKHGRDLG